MCGAYHKIRANRTEEIVEKISKHLDILQRGSYGKVIRACKRIVCFKRENISQKEISLMD